MSLGGTVPALSWSWRLAFTRYCYAQYCIVYDINTGGGEWSNIAHLYMIFVLQSCGQCRLGGAIKG